MWKVSKNDSEDLDFAIACLFKQAITLDEFKTWVLKVIEQIYIFELVDFDAPIFKIFDVIGFSPDSIIKEETIKAIYGIAYLRNVELYDVTYSKQVAISALNENQTIMNKFDYFFDIKL